LTAGYKDVAPTGLVACAFGLIKGLDGSKVGDMNRAFFPGHFFRAIIMMLVLAWSYHALGADVNGDINYAAGNWDGLDKVKTLLKTNLNLISHKGFFGASPLHNAAEYGNKDIAEFLLEKKADIEAKDYSGRTPLHWAAFMGHRDVAAVLLAHQADINAKDNDGGTPLHYAASCGGRLNYDFTGGYTEVVKLLLDKNADVNALDNAGQTPLHWALTYDASTSVEELLRQHGGQDTPPTALPTIYMVNSTIHRAAKRGNLEKVQEMIKANPSLVFATEYPGMTPLHWAAKMNHEDVVKFLLANKADINAKNLDGDTPLHLAAKTGHPEIVALLLAGNAVVDRTDNCFGWTALHNAAAIGDTNVARLLLANKADINAKDRLHGKTPLHVAVSKGQKEMVEFLLVNGADPNAGDEFGGTSMHEVAFTDNTDIAKVLLAHNAKINARAEGYRGSATPLHFAKQDGNKKMIWFLRLHGGLDLPLVDFGPGP
jgi:ankyrin repeat protein